MPINCDLLLISMTRHKKMKAKKEILLGIGNRYDNSLQFVVVEIVRRNGSYSLAGYVSVVRSPLRQRQRALLG